MADEKLQFTFFGKYLLGDSFKQLDADVKNAQKATKDMSGAALGTLRSISGCFSGELNAVMNQSLNILNQMAKGGIWGVMGAAAQAGLSLAIEGIKSLIENYETMEERLLRVTDQAQAFHDSLKRISDSGAIKRMKSALDEATTGAKEAMAAIERAAAAVNALEGAKGASAAAAVQENIAGIILEKTRAVANSLNEFDKAVIEAEADLKIANIELTEAQRKSAEAVDAARRGVETAQKKQMQAIDNVVAAQRAVEIAENDYKKAKIHGAVKQTEYENKLKAAREAEKAALIEKAKADNDLAIALEKQSEAESRQSAAIATAETKIVKLSAERDKAARKLEESTNAEADLMTATKGLASAYDEEAGERRALAQELENQKKTLQESERDRLEEIGGKISAAEKQIERIETIGRGIDKGERAYLQHHEWMGKPWERSASGGLANFGDYQKSIRWKERYDRDIAAHDAANDKKADRIRANLEKGKNVSQKDRDFLKNWDDFKKQRDGTESIETDIRNWKEEQTQISKDTKTAVENIENKIKEVLGVK